MSCEVYFGVDWNRSADSKVFYFDEISLGRDKYIYWAFSQHDPSYIIIGKTKLQCLLFDEVKVSSGCFRCRVSEQMSRYDASDLKNDSMKLVIASELKKLCEDKSLLEEAENKVNLKCALAYIKEIPDDKVCLIYIV